MKTKNTQKDLDDLEGKRLRCNEAWEQYRKADAFAKEACAKVAHYETVYREALMKGLLVVEKTQTRKKR